MKERLGDTGFSDRTLEAYVELNPADGEDGPDAAYWERATGFLKVMQGQYNHDVSESVADFKKNWKPDVLDGAKTVPDAGSSEIEELKAQLKTLGDRMAESERGKARAETLVRVRRAMEAQGASDGYVLDKTLQGAELAEGRSVEELASDMLKAYDAELKACRGDGAKPRAGGGGSKVKSVVDSYFERKAAREGWKKE